MSETDEWFGKILAEFRNESRDGPRKRYEDPLAPFEVRQQQEYVESLEVHLERLQTWRAESASSDPGRGSGGCGRWVDYRRP